jgi:cyclase
MQRLLTVMFAVTAASSALNAQGPPPSSIIPCGVPSGAPAGPGGPPIGPSPVAGTTAPAQALSGALLLGSNLPGGLRLRHVQGSVYMLSGAGANIAIQAGSEGVLLVDSGRIEKAAEVIAALRQLSQAPLQYIINTSGDPDHVGGNEAVSRAGRRLTSALGPGGGAIVGAAIMARQAVEDRLIKEKAPECALPTMTYDVYPRRSLFFNGEGIKIRHMAAAHSDGDSFVFFRRSDVVATGDIFNTNLYPFVDLEHGGSINGVVAALNELLEITIPALKQEGGTYVIPGHGRLADEADVSEYRDMVTIVRDRVRALVARKMTLEQVKAERPTLDYDGRYGGSDGPWTPDRFVEAVYKSLTQTTAGNGAGGQKR